MSVLWSFFDNTGVDPLKKRWSNFFIKLQSVSILAIDETESHTHIFKARSRIILSRNEPLFH